MGAKPWERNWSGGGHVSAPPVSAKPWEKNWSATPTASSPVITEENIVETPAWRSALNTTVKALDYPGGLVRTGLAGITGNADIEDVKSALKGQSPTSAQYMERAGVPEGDVVNYPLVGDVSSRDLIGFAGDVVTDPLTALSKAGKLGANIVDRGLMSSGKKMYKSGFKKVDDAVSKKGAEPLSDLLLKRGVMGSNKTVQKAADDMLTQARTERELVHQSVDEAGGLVDPAIAFGEARAAAVKMGERDPGLKDLADKLKEKLDMYINHGPVPVSQASEWKTNIYNSLPESAFDKFGRVKGPAQKIEKLSANGLKNQISEVGNSVAPGMGDKISSLNETMHTLLSAKKPLAKAVTEAGNKNMLTTVDAMIGTGTALATHSPGQTAAMMAMKKAADLSKTTGFRTVGGRGLIGAGKTGGATPFVNRAIIQKNPWFGVGNEGDK